MNSVERLHPPLGPLTDGQCFALAVLMEATVPKPGNVHRGADFEDLAYPDLLVAATLVAPIIESAVEMPLGQTILSAIAATRSAVGTNTNLGTVLLLAPLAKVPVSTPLRDGVAEVLGDLTAQDTADVYEAIRLARPGGLGSVETADVTGPPPEDLVAAMRLAADRDLIARQYVNNYQDVFETVVPQLVRGLEARLSLSAAIVQLHLELMRQFPDSLIARRRGIEVARESSARAAAVLQSGLPGDEDYHRALAEFDFWLRSDSHARNPGTTADLVAAGLFVALREGIIQPPFRLAEFGVRAGPSTTA